MQGGRFERDHAARPATEYYTASAAQGTLSYGDRAPGGCVFQRRWTQSHCSGYARMTLSRQLCNAWVSFATSPVIGTGGYSRSTYFRSASDQIAKPGITAAPLCAASRANPLPADAGIPKKSTNTPASSSAFWS